MSTGSISDMISRIEKNLAMKRGNSYFDKSRSSSKGIDREYKNQRLLTAQEIGIRNQRIKDQFSRDKKKIRIVFFLLIAIIFISLLLSINYCSFLSGKM